MKAKLARRRVVRWVVGLGLASVALVLIAASLRMSGTTGPSAQADTIVVYKRATCTCCSKWIAHLKSAGFAVEVHNERGMASIKEGLGVPAAMGSCHTATVGGYVIEGHVPARDIRRLLAERPAARGLVVPGMPIGSPGMEQGDRIDTFQVLLFDGTRTPRVYSQHGGVAPVPEARQPQG